MRSRASGISLTTREKARSSVMRSLNGSIRPAQEIVGTSGSSVTTGKAAGSTPL